jgi:hypothetical protein
MKLHKRLPYVVVLIGRSRRDQTEKRKKWAAYRKVESPANLLFCTRDIWTQCMSPLRVEDIVFRISVRALFPCLGQMENDPSLF